MSKIIKLATSALSILLSIALIILGISICSSELVFEADTISVTAPQLESASGLYDQTQYEFYGGDAYTGIQQAGADAANNAAQAGESIETVNYNLMQMADASYSTAKAISKQIERATTSFNSMNTVLESAGYLLVIVGAFLLIHYISRLAECILVDKKVKAGSQTPEPTRSYTQADIQA